MGASSLSFSMRGGTTGVVTDGTIGARGEMPAIHILETTTARRIMAAVDRFVVTTVASATGTAADPLHTASNMEMATAAMVTVADTRLEVLRAVCLHPSASVAVGLCRRQLVATRTRYHRPA